MIKKKFDTLSVYLCLVIHFGFFWVSNTDLLHTSIKHASSQLQYWNYQVILVLFYMLYLIAVIIFSMVLKRIQHSKIRYGLLFFTILVPVLFCISSGNFMSKSMSIANISGEWFGILIFKYFIYWIILVLSISAIIFIARLVRKKLKKKGDDNELH
mgnify:CR=1 FL=1